jgi:hypothetical protein
MPGAPGIFIWGVVEVSDGQPKARHPGFASGPVVVLQVICDGLGVGRIDRSAERIDHLGDLGVLPGRAQERRIHRHIIEAVAAEQLASTL